MKLVAIFSLVMSIFFITIGIAMPFFPPAVLKEGNMKYFVAVVLVSYGAFRLSRAIKMLKST